MMLRHRNFRRLRAACSGATVLFGFCAGAHADCFDAASQYHQVNPLVLRAIAWAESHNEPLATHQNPNGTMDYGVMQINSVHLPALGQYGISTQTLMDPCANVYVAAWHLRHQMNKYGNTLAAVGAYHSESPELRDHYAQRIVQILKDWKLAREVP
jgi:soluble lytic murein transglycosylase-like protein